MKDWELTMDVHMVGVRCALAAVALLGACCGRVPLGAKEGRPASATAEPRAQPPIDGDARRALIAPVEVNVDADIGRASQQESEAAPHVESAEAALVRASQSATAADMTEHFLAALRKKDVSSLLDCFSRTRPFYVVTTGYPKKRRARFTYEELKRGLKPDGEFTSFMFGDDNLDSFRDYAVGYRGPWVAVSPNRFAPPEYAKSRKADWITVSWTKDGARFMVDEIAAPI
jgi:hypothetical protein